MDVETQAAEARAAVAQLFNKAELRPGTGWGSKQVQIFRQTPVTGGARG